MLPRSSKMTIGLHAMTTAAVSPAPAPATRRTARKSTRTVSMPSATCGNTIAHTWKPKMRRERACIQSAPGNLSTETVPHGSAAPKMKSCQLIDMLRAAPP